MKRDEKNIPTYICGGTLVSSTRVVTGQSNYSFYFYFLNLTISSAAAHCVQYKGELVAVKPRDLVLLLGAYNLSNAYEARRVIVVPSEIVVHDKWNPDTSKNLFKVE